MPVREATGDPVASLFMGEVCTDVAQAAGRRRSKPPRRRSARYVRVEFWTWW